MGDSIAFWAKPSFEDARKNQPWKYPALSIHGLRLEKLPELLRNKLQETTVYPKMIVIHCGTNNIVPKVSVTNLITTCTNIWQQVVAEVSAINPKIKLMWSDILPKLHYHGIPYMQSVMSTNNVNACFQFCALSNNQYFVQHPYVDPREPAMYRKTSKGQDNTHLSDFKYLQQTE